MTKDGYINTVYRISAKKGEPSVQGSTGKPVVIYQHGLIDCCSGIVAAGEDSLGIRLVNAGYDLWLNNSRGNRYSRDHQEIDVDECSWDQLQEYFRFSFSELAEFDQPALWEYVQSVTKVQKITYIGHSQGTTQMFAALSENGEFFSPRLE